MDVDGFDWDSGNRVKNLKHGITTETIEAFFHQPVWVGPDIKHADQEDRFLAVGKDSAGRHMIVAFTFRAREGKRLIRPISARNMHKKEVAKYEQAFAKNEE